MAGTIVADTLQDGAGNSTAMDNAIYGSAKAWVNFNGNSGSVAIRAQYNVSSITYRGAGAYTVNFTNALTDANYAPMGSFQSNAGAGVCYGIDGGRTSAMAQTASACQIILNTGGSSYDSIMVSFAAFR